VKKIKRLLVVLPLILVSLSFPSQLPSAYAGVTDCLSIGFPTASISSTRLTITASVSVRCTNQQIGTGGGAFLYSVNDESSAQCDGPRDIYAGTFATLTCSIPVGPPYGSSRTGYTSTTIRIWSAWDFSTAYVTASHQPIPSRVASVPIPTPTYSNQPLPVSTPNPTYLPQTTQSPITNGQAMNEILTLVDSLSSQVDSLSKQLSKTYKATCKNGVQTKYVTGSNPKCPAGYTLKSKKKLN
jgi:hypothetical protein